MMTKAEPFFNLVLIKTDDGYIQRIVRSRQNLEDYKEIIIELEKLKLKLLNTLDQQEEIEETQILTDYTKPQDEEEGD